LISIRPSPHAPLDVEIKNGCPFNLHVDFPFDDLDPQRPQLREIARQEALSALGAVVDWIIDEQERERESSFAYRSIATAIVLRRPYCSDKTIEEIARAHRLNRIVLHRHMTSFIRNFRLKPLKRLE
jgi:hypothetical protein